MALDLTQEQRTQGEENFRAVTEGLSRRGFLQGVLAAAGAGAAGAGAYFGYSNFSGKPVRAALIGCGDEGGVLAGEHDPNFLEIVAVSDIRPYNQERIFKGQGTNHIRKGLNYHYGNDARKRIKLHEDYREILADPEIEAVIIALPLHLHDTVAIEAMQAGKHVLCEKLMARTVGRCKDMIKAARETGKVLSVGHQRHYSLLYAHALEVVKSGVLGDIRHIRALWHRNNTWDFEPENDMVTDPKVTQPYYRDSWFKEILAEDYNYFQKKPELLKLADCDDVQQLIRWRLYDRTGGGLMAELGSHQLDACSIFLGKVKPLAVSGTGVKSFYEPGKNDRDCDDHVFCTFEFPGPGYFTEQGNPDSGVKDPDDIVVVTYSSVSTNGFENYGECLMGSRGTMIVEQEQSVMLYKEAKPGTAAPPKSTDVAVSTVGADKPQLEAAASGYAPAASATAAAAGGGPVSRGYREEMNHFAHCIREWDPSVGYAPGEGGKFKQQLPRCHGEVAMADAILALSANLAMATRQRIEFKPEWFKWDSAAVPGAGGKQA